MDTSGNQMSDIDDVEFYWENDQLDVHVVFRRDIDRPFSPSVYDDFEMGSMAENPLLIEQEQDKENFPPLPSTPVFERPTQPPTLRSCLLGTRIENNPNYVYGNLFDYFLSMFLSRFFNIYYC